MLTPGAGPPPRVSVITIFLDAEAFLAEAVESVLAQSFDAFEILLVDDGSTDGGGAIARDYASRHPGRVRYLQHEGGVNRGMSASRNRGVAEARGELIAFIDADDVWRPGKLARQVAIMDAHPAVGLSCGAVNYWSSWEGGVDQVVQTGRAPDRVVPPPQAMLEIYPLGRADAPCPSDLMLRTRLVRELGGFEEHYTGVFSMYEDQAFLAKVYLNAPIHISGEVWLDYRQHADSCVAQVNGAGRYDEVRRYFLDWLDAYLRDRAEPAPPAVLRALRRAHRPYRRPALHAVLTAPRTAASLVRRGLGRG